ncbi:MAG: glycosyltransferase [Candidatus Bathyarchaeia archaeon]
MHSTSHKRIILKQITNIYNKIIFFIILNFGWSLKRLKRVLCVIPNDPLYQYFKKGEVKTRYFNPCNFFSEVHVISLSDWDVNAEKVQKLAGEGRLYIHPIGKLSRINMPFITFKVLLKLKMLKPNILRTYNPLHGFIGVIAGRILHIPTVISLHTEYDEERYFRKKLYGKESFLLDTLERIIEKIALSSAECVICVSQHVKKYAARYGAKKPIILYNKVDLKLFRADLDSVNAKRELGLEGKKVLLYVGRIDKQKNVGCLIRTVRELLNISLKDVHLLLVGSGSEVKQLKRLASQINVQDKITFIGPVPHEKLPIYYAAADIYVHSSLFEGFGIPLIEALASGKPIVAGKVGAIPEIVEDAGILVFPLNPKFFANAISKILQDENLRTEMSKKAKEKATKYDSNRLEKEEMKIYFNFLSKTDR